MCVALHLWYVVLGMVDMRMYMGTERMFTFFSMEHRAKLQPHCSARLQSSASIHSDLPEFGTPVTMLSSPGTTCYTKRP